MSDQIFSQQQKFYCPICRLESPVPVEDNELEISYKVKGKVSKFIKGWHACARCLVHADKCVQQSLKDRFDRGRSLDVNRDQFKKLQESGCGCGG
jgi:hypothetical protein